MSRYWFITATAVFLLAGCTQTTSKPVADSGVQRAESSLADAGLSIGQPVTHANLTVFPILSAEPRNDDRYITLDEGLGAGSIEVLEGSAVSQAADGQRQQQADAPAIGQIRHQVEQQVEQQVQQGSGRDPESQTNQLGSDVGQQQRRDQGRDPRTAEQSLQNGENPNDIAQQIDNLVGGNSVNTLYVINRSDKPLYLMPGELVLGGDQDRMIAQEVIIPPNGQPTPIEVFCVEQGRWGGRALAQTVAALEEAGPESIAMSGDFASPDEAAQGANAGKFIASLGAVSNAVRKAAQIDKDQSKVWSNVEMENNKSGTQSDTSTFSFNYADAQSLKRLNPYFDSLKAPIADHENVVGIIVAIDGQVQSLDVFQSTPLFRKLWPKMLKGFALEAAGSDKQDEAAKCSHADAVAFCIESCSARLVENEHAGQLHVNRRESDQIISLSAAPHEDAALGSAVHEAAFKK